VEGIGLLGGAAGHLIQVHAGAKRFAVTGDEDGADARIFNRTSNGLQDRPAQLYAKRVALFGTVER